MRIIIKSSSNFQQKKVEDHSLFGGNAGNGSECEEGTADYGSGIGSRHSCIGGRTGNRRGEVFKQWTDGLIDRLNNSGNNPHFLSRLPISNLHYEF